MTADSCQQLLTIFSFSRLFLFLCSVLRYNRSSWRPSGESSFKYQYTWGARSAENRGKWKQAGSLKIFALFLKISVSYFQNTLFLVLWSESNEFGTVQFYPKSIVSLISYKSFRFTHFFPAALRVLCIYFLLPSTRVYDSISPASARRLLAINFNSSNRRQRSLSSILLWFFYYDFFCYY